MSQSAILNYCDESVSRGRKTGTKGRKTGTKGRRTGTIGTKERGNEKPYGLVQIEYLDRGTSPRHVWTWRGRVTLFLDVYLLEIDPGTTISVTGSHVICN